MSRMAQQDECPQGWGSSFCPGSTTSALWPTAFLSLSWGAFRSWFQRKHQALWRGNRVGQRGGETKGENCLFKITLENSLSRHLQHVPPVLEHTAVSSLSHQRKKSMLLNTNACENTVSHQWGTQYMQKEITWTSSFTEWSNKQNQSTKKIIFQNE